MFAFSSQWYSAYSLYKICIPLHFTWNDKELGSPKWILNIDLSYLLKRTEVLLKRDFRK